MAAISMLNPKAEVARASQALAVNMGGARGIQDVLKTNLGPKGTMKMLVGGAGDIKITKDGNILLHEMQIQHPTASLIARASTAQDDITGDGTTSTVLLIGEFLKQADTYISEGLHPRVVTEGFEIGKAKSLEVLDSIKIPIVPEDKDRILNSIAQTSLATKVHPSMAEQLTPIIVSAVDAITVPEKPIDLHMVEMMEMQHRSETESTLVRGLVLDHGGRHPDMPKRLENCYILTCNVSLEYEKTEVNSGFFYKSAEDREKLVVAERKFIEDRVQKILELKRKVCTPENKKTFVVINQKGVDPMSLDAFAKEGVMALRRAKRRNMERLTLACGGVAMNSVDELDESCLGTAGLVYEHVLGENKFTFVEECANPQSVTILMKGPNKHSLMQIKDALRDGLRAVKNAVEDGCVIPGAGAYEVACHIVLKRYLETVKGKARLGIQAYADGMMIIPKTLATNAGYDSQEVMVKLLEEARDGAWVGLDCDSGEAGLPADKGIYDNYRVKKQMVNSCTVIASNLLLVDEIMRAGMSSLKG